VAPRNGFSDSVVSRISSYPGGIGPGIGCNALTIISAGGVSGVKEGMNADDTVDDTVDDAYPFQPYSSLQ
jgi:hypothetical protein